MGKIYIIGGVDNSSNILKRTLSYDSVRQTYVAKNDMSIERYRLRHKFTDADFRNATDIVVAAGYNTTNDAPALRTSEKYNLASGQWSPAPDLNTEHKDGCMAQHR